MNILVTGSAGMIGGYVVNGLIDKGHTVIGVDLRKNDNFNVNHNDNANLLAQVVLDLDRPVYPFGSTGTYEGRG